MVESENSLLGWVATFCNLLQYVYISVFLIRDLVKKNSSNHLSFFPYLAMITAALLWLKYGLLRQDNPLIVINVISLILNSISAIVFHYYCTSRTFIYKQTFVAFVIVIVILNYVRFFVSDLSSAESRLGLVCAAMTILSYGSPLSATMEVVNKKSTISMSFALCFSNTFLAILWMAYGIALNDAILYIPNLVGMILCLLQLSLFFLYPSVKSTVIKSSNVPYKEDV